MRKEIEQGKEYGEWLLHTHEALEWPFTVVLDNRFEHRWIPRNTAVCNDVLTDIIAVGRAVP